MSVHPAIAAVLAADLVAALAALWGMAGAVRVAAGYAPGSASAGQLELERISEEVSLAGRAALAASVAGAGLLLLAVNHVLPALVPGAMCGLGVLQAMPGGVAALGLRVAALVGLWAWATLDTLDRREPLGPLAGWAARGLLAAGALSVASGLRTGAVLLAVDLHSAVSCCAAVVDLARAAGGPGQVWEAGPWHAGVLVLGGVGLVGWALRGPSAPQPRLLAVALLAWVGLAEWVLLDVTAPYHYGLLGHRCPFCLFLAPQWFAGYLLHGSLLVGLLEGGALVVCTGRAASLSGAPGRARWAGRTLAAAVALHLLVSFLPVVVHRLRTGTFFG